METNRVLTNANQMRLLILIKELSLKGAWRELKLALTYMNKVLNRYCIDAYWKYLFLIMSTDFDNSIDYIPQFLDCLNAMNLKNKDEVVYSIVCLLLSKNQVSYGTDLLKMYHLTKSNKQVSSLAAILNTNLDYIKWKESIQNQKLHHNNEYSKQIAEKCCFQIELLLTTNELADYQIKQLSEIYVYYNKINQLGEILEEYAKKHPEYLNAHKYLFDYKVQYHDTLSIPLFKKIVELSPSDSIILRYFRQLRNLLLSIDCMFEIMDYNEWRYSKECWSSFAKLLLRCEKSNEVRECILKNWRDKEWYWMPYHFRHSAMYKQIESDRLRVAVMLLGPSKFVQLVSSTQTSLNQLTEEIDVYLWLFSINK